MHDSAQGLRRRGPERRLDYLAVETKAGSAMEPGGVGRISAKNDWPITCLTMTHPARLIENRYRYVTFFGWAKYHSARFHNGPLQVEEGQEPDRRGSPKRPIDK